MVKEIMFDDASNVNYKKLSDNRKLRFLEFCNKCVNSHYTYYLSVGIPANMNKTACVISINAYEFDNGEVFVNEVFFF